jgi:O-glycosyl hydrolase
MINNRVLFLTGFLTSASLLAQPVEVALKIDGSTKYQTMDGFGVNINAAWWYNGEYGDTKVVQPAIDLLVDSLGATLFRAVIEEIDWETVNDDNDPNNFNLTYYDSVFSGDRFQGVWKTLRYLNQKGITDDLIISFMGAPPAAAPLLPPDPQKSWMGGTDHSIASNMEDELVESIAALLYYMRNTAKVQFRLVSPMNETDVISMSRSENRPDGIVEGPDIPDAGQYVRIIRKLAKKMDFLGMSDIRFVAPDAGGEVLFKAFLNEMVSDPYLMDKMACWGVHQYGNDAANYLDIVNHPDNPNKAFWVTETAGIGNLLGQLDDNGRAYIFWDGFDCVYQHARRNGYGSIPPNDWVFWFGPEEGQPLIEYAASTNNWVPRKQFYQFSQVMKFVSPGAVRIGISGLDSSLVGIAFYDEASKTLSLVGINKSHVPVNLNGTLTSLPAINSLEMYYTNSSENVHRAADIMAKNEVFKTSVPADCIFTITGTAAAGESSKLRMKPEPSGWYAGDMHVHRDCGGPVEGILPESKLVEMMEVNDLAVISVLADMGDAEVKPSEIDLPKVNGKDSPLSVPGRTIHYDAEWHWDPFGTTFEHKALGGHIVLLGLSESHQIWEESPYKILEYGRKQNAIVGFCHTEYLNDKIQKELNCCIPIEYPVEAALGTTDFFSEDVYGSNSPNYGNYSADATINAYYKLLNCGIRLGLCAGTDYPCNNNEPLGTLLTYVNVKGPFTYRKWVEGIRDGKTVVARNGHLEFIDMIADGKYRPGDDIKIEDKGTVSVEVKWTSVEPQTGSLELVYNGIVVAAEQGTVQPDGPIVLNANQVFTKSGWLCARRMDENGHQTHTAPIYVTVNNEPVRASANDAMYFVKWIDHLVEQTSPGHEWNQYFTHDLDVVQGRYIRAKEIYLKIAKEAQN